MAFGTVSVGELEGAELVDGGWNSGTSEMVVSLMRKINVKWTYVILGRVCMPTIAFRTRNS